MLKRFVLGLFGAGFRFAIASGAAHLILVQGILLPSHAAEEIEAKVQVCRGCHGEGGVPVEPKTVPIIWGQQKSYLVKQLHDYRSGDRESPIMSPIARSLAQEELRKIAAYFAAKDWPERHASAPSTSPPAAIAQCQPCHQAKFEGGAPAPRLAGLSYEYLLAAMHGFANGERTNNGDMPKFMRALTESERDAIARYLSEL